MRLAWLHTIRQSTTAVPASTGEPKQRLLSFGIGYCPGCERLRTTNSPSCTYCGSAASVAADA